MIAESVAAIVSLARGIATESHYFPGALLFASLLVPGDSAAADTSQGAQIAATCASCHDPTGRGQGIPPLTTLDEQTFVTRMHAFRASESPSHVMHAVALSLGDGELAAVARYLADKAHAGRQP